MLEPMRYFLSIFLFFSSGKLLAESPSILDLVVIGKDTIVASTHDMTIIVSHDGGKTWKTTGRQLIKQLGLDGKRIWGIDCWIGIHERSYSRLFYSDDVGVSWKQIELDTDLFFAMEFIEIRGRLWIIDDKGNLWEHKQTNVETSLSWKNRTNYNKYSFASHATALKDYHLRVSADSLFVFDLKLKKEVKKAGLNNFIKKCVFVDTANAIMLDLDGIIYRYSFISGELKKIKEVTGYRYVDDLILVENQLFLLGTENDASRDYAVFKRINLESEDKEIEGLTGLDQSVCYVDNYKRIWIGTTKGIFMLEPGSDKCKQIL